MTKRRIIDAAMVLLLPPLMAYSLVGETFHEIAGTLMLLCFLAHHWLNRAWWKRLLRGRYTARRAFQTAVNLLLLVFMIAQPITGILISKHLYTFLPTANASAFVRGLHLPMAYWGFVLMSLHAGTHLGSMLPKKKGRTALLVCLSSISAYGLYIFPYRQIPKYLFLKLPFAFFDYSEPLLYFFADYLAVMILFAMLGYGITTLFTKQKKPSA